MQMMLFVQDEVVIEFSVSESTHKILKQNKSFEPENYDWRTHGEVDEIELEDGIQISLEETATNKEQYTDVSIFCIATLFSYTRATLAPIHASVDCV